jgi:hypothetical protein
MDRYTRRRRSAVLVVVIVTVVGAALLFNTRPVSTPPAAQPAVEVIAGAEHPVTVALDAATAWYATAGSFEEFTTGSDVTVISGSDRVGVTAVVDGTCWYGAIVNGTRHDAAIDTTGQSCTAEADQVNRAVVAGHTSEDRVGLDVAAQVAIDQALPAVLYWLTSTGSFDGFPSDALGRDVTAAIVPAGLELTAVVGSGCARTIVTSSGESAPRSC